MKTFILADKRSHRTSFTCLLSHEAHQKKLTRVNIWLKSNLRSSTSVSTICNPSFRNSLPFAKYIPPFLETSHLLLLMLRSLCWLCKNVYVCIHVRMCVRVCYSVCYVYMSGNGKCSRVAQLPIFEVCNS